MSSFEVFEKLLINVMSWELQPSLVSEKPVLRG